MSKIICKDKKLKCDIIEKAPVEDWDSASLGDYD
jgi:hypothetical protein